MFGDIATESVIPEETIGLAKNKLGKSGAFFALK